MRSFENDTSVGYSAVVKNLIKYILPNLIAVSALIVSYFAYNSTNPHVSILQTNSVAGPLYLGGEQDWVHFSFTELVITNVGGRTVSLIGIEKPENRPSFLSVIQGIINNEPDIKYNIFLVDRSLPDIQANPFILNKYKNMGFERLALLNRIILPGESIVFRLGVQFEVYDRASRLTDHILFGVDLVFNNGERYWHDIGSEVMEINIIE